MAYVYDPAAEFERKVNPDTLAWHRVGGEWERRLRRLVETHAAETGSRYAAMILHDWDLLVGHFWHVVPKEYARTLDLAVGAEVARTA